MISGHRNSYGSRKFAEWSVNIASTGLFRYRSCPTATYRIIKQQRCICLEKRTWAREDDRQPAISTIYIPFRSVTKELLGQSFASRPFFVRAYASKTKITSLSLRSPDHAARECSRARPIAQVSSDTDNSTLFHLVRVLTLSSAGLTSNTESSCCMRCTLLTFFTLPISQTSPSLFTHFRFASG